MRGPNGQLFVVQKVTSFTHYTCTLSVRHAVTPHFFGLELLCCGFRILSLHGAEVVPSSVVDYFVPDVPRALHMRRFLHIPQNLMMFYQVPPLSDPLLLPDCIGPCSVRDYMAALRRSRLAKAIFRAITCPNHIRYNEPCTFKELRDIAFNTQSLFQKAACFQRLFVESWNPTVREVSQMLYLSLSRHEEVQKLGMIQMIVELLYDFGILEKLPHSLYKCSDGYENKVIRLYGDCLSYQTLKGKHRNEFQNNQQFFLIFTSSPSAMYNDVFAEVTHPGKVDVAVQLINAVGTLRQGVGDLHISMHMLVVVFMFFYPGFLQVVQAVLHWKRIKLNPLTRYQSSRDLVHVVHSVLEHMRVREWAQML